MIRLLFILIFVSGFGQTYPPQVQNTECYGSYIAPSNGMPDYLQWFDADLSDSQIMRIGDADAFGVSNNRIRHNYSKDQTWNSDETLIKLSGYPAAILDAENYKFLYWANIPGYGRWANTQPNIVYGTNSNHISYQDVYTNQRTIIREFPEYTSVDFGYGEGNLSNNDRYIGLIGRNGTTTTVFVYDIPNDVVVGCKELPAGDLDWFSVSQSGNFAVVSWRPDGNADNEGLKSYDIFLNNEIHIADYTPHGDLGYDSDGNEVFVGYGDSPQWNAGYSLYMARLDGGGITNLFPYVNGLGIWGGSVSCRNIDRQGWAYISEQCCSTNPLAPREIFAIKLDNSGIVERYAKHHSSPNGYYHQCEVVPNRNGTKLIFASNYSDGSIGEVAPSFVLEVNQETLNTPTVRENLTVEKPLSVEYYNILGQKVSKQNLSKGFYIEVKTFQNRVERKKIIL